MEKNINARTTRQSTTLIQSEITLFNPNKSLFTRILLQYMWLKPQLEALYLHQLNLILRQHRISNMKDAYINSLQSVDRKPQLIRKYYKFQETIKQLKKIIGKRTKVPTQPQIKCRLFLTIRQKYLRIVRQRQIYNFKLKVNPQSIHPSKPTHKKMPSLRSPESSKKVSKQKLNNTKVDYREQDYGLRRFHIKNKLSLHQARESNSGKKPKSKASEYKPKLNSFKSKHKKSSSSHTPKKPIVSSRKLSGKELLTLRSQKVKSEKKIKPKKKA